MSKIAAALLATLSVALAQQPREETFTKQVRLELLIARIPEARAIELQPMLREPARCGAALEKILAMIGRNEAELVDWPVVVTKSGQRAVAQNVREIRYVTEYAAPDLNLPTSETAPVAVPTPTAPPAEEKKPAKPREPFEVRVVGGLPSAFEKRDVGVTFEVEPTIGPDGVTVDIQISPQHVTLIGWHKHTLENGRSEKVTVEQPDFQEIRTNANITVTSGQSMLLAFQKPQDAPKQIEVFILTTTVLGKDGPKRDKPQQAQRRAK